MNRIGCRIVGIQNVEQDRILDDEWRILGDVHIELILGRVSDKTLAGSTRCVKVQLTTPPTFDLASLHVAVSIRHRQFGRIQHAICFRAKGFSVSKLIGEGVVTCENLIDADRDGVLGIGHGGRVELRLIEDQLEETEDERRAKCAACPSGKFLGNACEALICCQQKTPDPARWERAVRIGACPRGHFASTTQFEVLAPMRPGRVSIAGFPIPTL